MTRALYSLLVWLAQPFFRARLARRGVAEPGYLEAVGERFGHYTQAVQPGAVWIHAVSLGEARAAAILIKALREHMDGQVEGRAQSLRLLLTCGTATGRAECAKLLRPGDALVWQPWDTPAAVRRFLTHCRPRVGILMETEVWPNMVALCKAQGLPLVLANARLSDKSLQESLRLAWLARPAFGALAAVYAQTEADAARLRQLGAPVQGVFGNLKFDATPDAAQLAMGRTWRAGMDRPVVLFASSREGEEKALLDGLARQPGGAVQWLIVPRHPQRFDEVAALVAGAGFAVSRRSAWADGPPAAEASTIWLGDSLGEMALYYGLADAALLGGSFEPLGGQNLIEAAACGCPVVMGPHTFNFAEAAGMAQQAGAALRVESLGDAVLAAGQLLASPDRQQTARAAAAAFVQQHRGATQRTVQALQALLQQQ